MLWVWYSWSQLFIFVTVVGGFLKALDFLYYVPIGAVLCGTRKEIRQNVLRCTVGIKWYLQKMYRERKWMIGYLEQGVRTVCTSPHA